MLLCYVSFSYTELFLLLFHETSDDDDDDDDEEKTFRTRFADAISTRFI